MKCLSISQPFADLIISGKKSIELRDWNTSFRGEFLIHAPIKIRVEDCKRLSISKKLPVGVIVGKAILYDVKKYNSQKELIQDKKFHHASTKFQNKKFGFMLKNPKLFRVPIPWKGLLGVNSSATLRPVRLVVWKRISTDLRPRHFDQLVTRTIGFDELPGAFGDYLEGRVTGRTVVEIA